MLTRGAGLNPELMEQERQLGPEPSDADTPPPRRRRGAAANTQEESTEGVRPGRPCHGCACKHCKGCASMCQTCMSSCTIDTSSWAATASCFLWERRKPFLKHADCTMHPVVLDDAGQSWMMLDSLPARTSAEPSSNG